MKEKTHQTDHPQVRRLNEIIEQKGISKADMARICGVSSQSVNNWFVRGTIGKSSAIKLADALGVSLAWLLGQEVDEKGGLKADEPAPAGALSPAARRRATEHAPHLRASPEGVG